jgi:multidrug resistance efflux pump
MRLSALALGAALFLSSCSSILGEPPTPEPFILPPTPTTAATLGPDGATPAAENAEATATPEAGATTTTTEPTATAVPNTTYTVQRGDVIKGLAIEGVVVESSRQDLVFAQAGTIATIAVAGPGPVKAGDLIAEQDLGELTDQIKQAQADLASAKQAFDRATAGARLPIRRAEIDLAAARDALEKARRPATPQQLATARAVLQSAEADLELTRANASQLKNQAQINFDEARKALEQAQAEYSAAAHAFEANQKDPGAEQRFINALGPLREAEKAVAKAQVEYDAARNSEVALVQKAEATVATAQAALDELISLPDEFTVKDAERNVQRAQLAVDEARAAAGADPTLQSAVELAEQALADLEAQADARRIYAPFDGEIITISTEVGAEIEAGATVATILNTAIPADQREIRVNQLEGPDASRVRVGMAVTISLIQTPNQQITGKVARILGGSDPAAPRIVFISIDGTINSPAGEAAAVIFELQRKQNVLWLPPQAIGSDGRSFVTLQDGNTRVEIETGLIGTDRVEILNGLSEGQIVLSQ